MVRDPAPFEELVKLAETEPIAERKESSGLIDLAGLALGEARRAEAPPPPSASADPALPAAPGETPKPRGARRRHYALALLVGCAVAAAAVIASRRPAKALPVAIDRPRAVLVSSTSPLPAPQRVAAGNERDETGVYPSSLPALSPARDTSRAPQPLARASSQTTAVVSAVATPASSASATTPEATPVVVASVSSVSGGDGPSLLGQMEQAVGVAPSAGAIAPSAPVAPDGAENSAPLKPSVGAIQSALGAAIPAARACMDQVGPTSHALITFRSDGSAQNVSVSGWAAGKPAEICIHDALMKARLPPFVVDTYSVPVTIRAE